MIDYRDEQFNAKFFIACPNRNLHSFNSIVEAKEWLKMFGNTTCHSWIDNSDKLYKKMSFKELKTYLKKKYANIQN